MNIKSHRLVLNPDGFFRSESEKPRFLIPALVVFGVGLVGLVRRIYMTNYTISAVEGGVAGGTGGGIAYLFALPSVLRPFVSWIIVTGVLLGVCVYLGGEGDAGETLRIAGWGYLPALLGAVIALTFTVHILGGTNPSGVSEAIGAQTSLRETLRSTEMTVIRYTLTVWQGFIWMFGIKHAQKLKLRRAAVPAAAGVAVIVSWDVLGDRIVSGIIGVVF